MWDILIAILAKTNTLKLKISRAKLNTFLSFSTILKLIKILYLQDEKHNNTNYSIYHIQSFFLE